MTESLQPAPGQVLDGRYLLEERLGRGGMSTVWRALDQVLNRRVAVKIVAEMEDAEVTAERFRREARATAALNHPNIVTVFDAGVDHDRPYLVMELLPGRTLSEDLRERGAFPADEVRSIALQVAAALGAAHESGLVHRDIKPGNIARTADGGVKVVDFGITHIIDEAVSEGHAPLTATGAVIGTAAYLAPEQARAERVDGRADLYALGCVLYALLTGKPPFQGPTAVSTMMAHATEPVPDIREARPDVPPQLAAVVTALLAKDPEARPASAEAVAAALQADTAQEATQLLPPPVVGEETTTVVPASDLPAPTRAHPADPAGPAVGAPVSPTRAVPVEEPEELPPLRDEEQDGRKGILVGIVALAVLLAAGFGWWLLTRDADLTTTPDPTAAAPATESPEPTIEPAFEPTESVPAEEPTVEPTTVEPLPEPTTTQPEPEPTAPPPVVEEPATQEPPAEEPPAEEPPAEEPPADDGADTAAAAEAAQSAADDLSNAVRDLTTGGGPMDNEDRKRVDEGLRDLAAALRDGNDQQASDALSAVDQALSDSGHKDQFTGLYDNLKNLVDAWKAAL